MVLGIEDERWRVAEICAWKILLST
jgi:hypothetical protein